MTATKLTAPLSETAASVTVLDAQAVEQRRVRTLEDLSSAVPNVQLNNSLGAGTLGYLTIRGLGNGPGSWDPAATIFVDDIPYNDFFGYAAALIDVRRIEVLRGPQGTLYGGFAEAGVIDVRSRLPGSAFESWGAVTLASRNGVQASGALSVPVATVLRLGIAGLTERSDSPVRNVVTRDRPGRRADALRLVSVLTPVDRVEAVFTFSEQRLTDDDGVQYLPLDRATYNRVIAPSGLAVGKFELANDFQGQRRADTSGQSLRVTWSAGQADVVAVASNRRFKGPYVFDFDYTPLSAPTTPGFGVPVISDSAYNTTNRYYELRAQQPAGVDGPLRWVLGVSRSEQKVDVLSDGVFPAGFGMFVPPGGRAGFNDATGEGSNQALFGQATWRLLDRRLGLTAGVRRESATRSGDNREVVFGTPSFSSSVDADRTLPKLGVDWRLDGNTVLYANWATGWRPGGVNLYANTSTFGGRTADPVTYGVQRTRTVEAGINHRSERWQASAAVFTTRVNDYQETVLTGTGTAYLANVPSVKINGADAELRWLATRALTLEAGVGVARARYDEYFFGGNLLSGRQLANRPDWNARFAAQWQEGPWSFGADLTGLAAFQSAYQVDGRTTRVPGHWIAALDATYRRGPWSLRGAVENLSDKQYFVNSNYVVAGFQVPVGMAGAPRTLSLRGRYDF